MLTYTSEDMVLALDSAPVDSRTGNRVVYNASWQATTPSMIGKRNEDWVQREIRWFLSGSDSLEIMEPPVPKAWGECAGWDNKVNSAYGHILFNPKGVTPSRLTPYTTPLYERMVATLKKEGAGTRHAVAIISDRDIHSLYTKNGRKDFICTNAINLMITDDWQLNLTAQMRSMDAVWGYRADYSMWDKLMSMLLKDLAETFPELERGSIFFQVVNLHVYPRHFDLLAKEAERVADEMNKKLQRSWMDKAVREEISDKGHTPSNTTKKKGVSPLQDPLF